MLPKHLKRRSLLCCHIEASNPHSHTQSLFFPPPDCTYYYMRLPPPFFRLGFDWRIAPFYFECIYLF